MQLAFTHDTNSPVDGAFKGLQSLRLHLTKQKNCVEWWHLRVTVTCYIMLQFLAAAFSTSFNMFYRPAARWRCSCVSARIPAAWTRGLGAMPKRRSWWTGASHLAGEPGWNGGFTQKMEARHAFSHVLAMLYNVLCILPTLSHCVLHSFVDTCEMFTDCVPMFCQQETPGCHGRLEMTWDDLRLRSEGTWEWHQHGECNHWLVHYDVLYHRQWGSILPSVIGRSFNQRILIFPLDQPWCGKWAETKPRNPGFVTWILVYFVGTHSVGDKRLWILQVQMSDVLKQCRILRVNSKLFATVGTAQTEDWHGIAEHVFLSTWFVLDV